MGDDISDKGPKPQSKFEWRPEDITILSKEEGDAAETEYEQWLAENDKKTADKKAQPSSDAVDTPPNVPKEPN
jgi:hypothetical protein